MCVGGSGRPGCCCEDVLRSFKVPWLYKAKLPGAKSPFRISQDILDKLLTFSVPQFLISKMWMIIVSLLEKSSLTLNYYITTKIIKIMPTCPSGLLGFNGIRYMWETFESKAWYPVCVWKGFLVPSFPPCLLSFPSDSLRSNIYMRQPW